MQYVRYGKPTGTSLASIKKSMRSKGKMAPFQPQRKIGLKALSLPARQELKFFDTTISTLIDSTTEVIVGSLNLVTQGDTASNRDGNIIVIKSIQIQGRMAQQSGAQPTSAPIVYMWLVLDRQPEGSNLALTGASAYLGPTLTDACSLIPVVPNQWMYKTIKKWAIPLVATAGVTTAYNNQTQNITYYHEFKDGLEIRFNGNAGTIADVMTNNLTLVAGCQDNDDTVTFSAQARIRFTG